MQGDAQTPLDGWVLTHLLMLSRAIATVFFCVKLNVIFSNGLCKVVVLFSKFLSALQLPHEGC